MPRTTDLLVKIAGDPRPVQPMALAGVTLEPLFDSAGGAAFGAAAESRWWRMRLEPEGLKGFGVSADDHAGSGAAWEACHRLMTDGFGAAGQVEFAEPDHEQQWLAPGPDIGGFAASCDPQPQRSDYPVGADDFWYRSDDFGEYDTARQAIGRRNGAIVRVAHLDTGYDEGHAALPQNLNLALQKNFVEGENENPDDARDVSEGFFTQMGHGTATMALLAGGGANGVPTIGVAPSAEVVPIRVASRVVLFKTSAIARALDYVHTLCEDPATFVHVITMSMGGLASQAWAEAVNRLYEAGVFIVTAAGNNYANVPTRYVVFPARFRRVVAACGLMADNTPYANLAFDLMAGNYGPDRAMEDAIAAYTPNTPWARIGCPGTIDHNGGGTSSATPQVAGAAALWIMKHHNEYGSYSEPWMRVEALRQALFASAEKSVVELPRDRFGRRPDVEDYVGNGALRAAAALRQRAAAERQLRRSDEADGRFPIWRVITGFGIDDQLDAREQMLELEATQLIQSSGLEVMLPDAPEDMTARNRRELVAALADHPAASSDLRQAIGARAPAGRRRRSDDDDTSTEARTGKSAVSLIHKDMAERGQKLEPPLVRKLRVYAIDPSTVSELKTLHLTEATIEIPWEGPGAAGENDTEAATTLEKGPVGEYLEVIDVDPPSRAAYAPVDLDHPYLLTQNGLAPSESNPQFHQQMVYAVAMRTIWFFERALGRVALWSPHHTDDGKMAFVRRLRIYPHALRQQNAFYSPDRKALLFGYFRNRQQSGLANVPEGLVFTALSHDIIAHETAHALLDGLHTHFARPTNPDVFAFHEAFADIVAMLQHFTMPEALRDQIARTRGDLTQRSLLTELAVQFGKAQGRGALRNAIGKYEKADDGTVTWREQPPSREDYATHSEPHARGSVLVSAVIDAFLQVYELRAREFIELATDGSGILPEGKLPPTLVERLAKEAAQLAEHVLIVCIRGLDYCPPVDITFGDYLRAVVTAERDFDPEGDHYLRTALVSAFRARGIDAEGVRHLSVDSVMWEPPPRILDVKKAEELLEQLDLGWDLDDRHQREAVFTSTRDNTETTQRWIESGKLTAAELSVLGFYPNGTRMSVAGIPGQAGRVTVHSVRPAWRVLGNTQVRRDIVLEVTQAWKADAPELGEYIGGCTLIVDPAKAEARYLIRKRVAHEERVPRQMAFESVEALGDRQLNYGRIGMATKEPFRMLHDKYRG